ncbi:MarR family transcriptional regulator [Streptomyces kanamyceticus]|nr:MarR family transcriptional regulator [Streptomyces kanamyceticus]
MANPGYGKRSVSAPAEGPRRPADSSPFGHLPPRESHLATLIDRLPDGAAMDAKTLAKASPLYGQQAVRTALNELSRAGHLRRVRCLAATGDNGTRWIFRTHWSRTARDSEWWACFLAGDAVSEGGAPIGVRDVQPKPEQPAADASGEPQPQRRSHTSTAYRVLAQLGRTEPRLTLSAADCATLEPLVSEWFARGATGAQLTSALTSGLPESVHSPCGFVARRLRDKLPPEPEQEAPAGRVPRVILECTACGVPGRSEALPQGLCRACTEGSTLPGVVDGADTIDVHRHAAILRATLTTRHDTLQPPRLAGTRLP